ncbi:MAG: hypothetical protein R3A11_06710 [Bdellovibrionota bacterium]
MHFLWSYLKTSMWGCARFFILFVLLTSTFMGPQYAVAQPQTSTHETTISKSQLLRELQAQVSAIEDFLNVVELGSNLINVMGDESEEFLSSVRNEIHIILSMSENSSELKQSLRKLNNLIQNADQNPQWQPIHRALFPRSWSFLDSETQNRFTQVVEGEEGMMAQQAYRSLQLYQFPQEWKDRQQHYLKNSCQRLGVEQTLRRMESALSEQTLLTKREWFWNEESKKSMGMNLIIPKCLNIRAVQIVLSWPVKTIEGPKISWPPHEGSENLNSSKSSEGRFQFVEIPNNQKITNINQLKIRGECSLQNYFEYLSRVNELYAKKVQLQMVPKDQSSDIPLVLSFSEEQFSDPDFALSGISDQERTRNQISYLSKDFQNNCGVYMPFESIYPWYQIMDGFVEAFEQRMDLGFAQFLADHVPGMALAVGAGSLVGAFPALSPILMVLSSLYMAQYGYQLVTLWQAENYKKIGRDLYDFLEALTLYTPLFFTGRFIGQWIGSRSSVNALLSGLREKIIGSVPENEVTLPRQDIEELVSRPNLERRIPVKEQGNVDDVTNVGSSDHPFIDPKLLPESLGGGDFAPVSRSYPSSRTPQGPTNVQTMPPTTETAVGVATRTLPNRTAEIIRNSSAPKSSEPVIRNMQGEAAVQNSNLDPRGEGWERLRIERRNDLQISTLNLEDQTDLQTIRKILTKAENRQKLTAQEWQWVRSALQSGNKEWQDLAIRILVHAKIAFNLHQDQYDEEEKESFKKLYRLLDFVRSMLNDQAQLHSDTYTIAEVAQFQLNRLADALAACLGIIVFYSSEELLVRLDALNYKLSETLENFSDHDLMVLEQSLSSEEGVVAQRAISIVLALLYGDGDRLPKQSMGRIGDVRSTMIQLFELMAKFVTKGLMSTSTWETLVEFGNVLLRPNPNQHWYSTTRFAVYKNLMERVLSDLSRWVGQRGGLDDHSGEVWANILKYLYYLGMEETMNQMDWISLNAALSDLVAAGGQSHRNEHDSQTIYSRQSLPGASYTAGIANEVMDSNRRFYLHQENENSYFRKVWELLTATP